MTTEPVKRRKWSELTQEEKGYPVAHDIDPDIPMNAEHKQQLLNSYMQASEDLYNATYGDTIAAGRRRDYEHLLDTLRKNLSADARSSMQVAMAREALNAFEEGMRRG